MESIEQQIKAGTQLISSNTSEAELIFKRLLVSAALDGPMHVQAQIGLAKVYFAQSKLVEANEIYLACLPKTRTAQLAEARADCLYGLSTIATKMGGLDQALEHCIQAQEIYHALELDDKVTRGYNQLATISYVRGNLDKALFYYKKVASQVSEKETEQSASVLSNIALIYFARGDIELAAEYFATSYNRSKDLNLERVKAISQMNLAEALHDLGQFNEARHHLEECYLRSQKNENARYFLTVSTTFAKHLVDLGELTKAHEILTLAVNHRDLDKYLYDKIEIFQVLAKYWFCIGDFQPAVDLLTDALQTINESQLARSKVTVLILLIEAHEALKNIKKAHEYLKIAAKLAWDRDSNLERAKVMVETARLNVNIGAYDKAEKNLQEATVFTSHINHRQLIFKVDALLAKIALGRYISSGQEQYYHQAFKQFTYLLQFAEQKRMIFNLVNALIIIGELHSFKKYHYEAIQSLLEALQIAEEHGLQREIHLVKERLALIQKRKVESGDPANDEEVLTLIMEELSQITRN